MPTIREQLRDVATGMNLSFYYGTKYDNNITADKDMLDGVYLLEPEELGFSIGETSGSFADYDVIHLQFLTFCDITETADSRAPKIDAMRLLAKKFVQKIITSSSLDLAFTNGTLRVSGFVRADYMDVNLTGIEISLRVQNLYPDILC